MLTKLYLKYPIHFGLSIAIIPLIIVAITSLSNSDTTHASAIPLQPDEEVVTSSTIPKIEVYPNNTVKLSINSPVTEPYVMPDEYYEILPPKHNEVVKRKINYKSNNYRLELTVVTEALFHEARGDDYKKVFSVIMNRLHHKNFPGTIHEVIHQHHQFSYLRDVSVNERNRREKKEAEKNAEIRSWVHEQFSRGYYWDDTNGALYYYAHNEIPEPDWWSDEYLSVVTVNHKFATWHKLK